MSNDVLLVNSYGLGRTVASGLTLYAAIAQGDDEQLNAAESKRRVIYRTAGTLSNLAARKTAGDRTGMTVRVRKNGASGNGLISFTSVNGIYEDLSNTDSVSAGDILSYEIVGGTGGTADLTFTYVANVFVASGTLTNVFCAVPRRTISNTTPLFNPLISRLFTSNQADAEWKVKLPAGISSVILKNLHVGCSARSAGSVTVTVQGATGAGTAPSVVVNATGDFEDTSNSIEVQDGDLLCINLTGDASASGITIDQVKVEVESADLVWHLVVLSLVNISSNNLQAPSGVLTSSTNESDVQVKATVAGMMLSLLSARIKATGLDALTLRANGADAGAPSAMSVPTTSTGWQHDTTNTYAAAVTDLLNTKATGAGGALVISAIAMTVQNAPSTFGLTVTVIGGGTVTSSPAGINCPGDCSQTYDADTEVTLTATPDVGWEFVGWTGDGTGDPRVVTMDDDKAVTATFAAIPVPTPVPGGGATILRTLGCGIWTAQIAERGGNVLVQAKATAGSMGRRLDDMSLGGATFLLSDVPHYCIGVLARLKAWQYELVLLRDGEEAWVGPISDSVVFSRNDIAVSCRDLFQWYERRVHPVDRSLKRDLCETFEIYATDAMSLDASPNITIDRDNCGIVERRTVLKSDYRYVADSLRELGDDGVDWTMLARTLRLRGFGGGDLVGRLGAEHVEGESVQVTKDGLGVASKWTVTGETPDGSDVAVAGSAGGVGSFTGLVQQVSQQELVVTQTGATAAAGSLLEVSGEEPMTLTCDLLPTAPFTFDKLISGNLFDVRMQVGVLTVDEVMMLQFVDVPDLVNEKVGVTLSRVGLPNVHQPEYAPAAGS